MKTLAICNLPNPIYARQNRVCYSVKDFPNKPNTIVIRTADKPDAEVPFMAIVSSKIKPGFIGIGLLSRVQLGLSFQDAVVVDDFDDRYDTYPTASKSKFTITQNFDKNSTNLSFTQDEIIGAIYKQLGKYPLANGHQLVIQVNKKSIGLTVETSGFLCKDKKLIELSSVTLQVTILNDSMGLNRKFFSPDFSFVDIGIGGLDEKLKDVLIRSLSSRAYRIDVVKKLGIKHKKGVLLYGPPGTGKTLIARNLSKLLGNVKTKVINGPEIMNKYIGQSEENVRNIFKEAIEDEKKAGDNSQLHVIIFDEIDAICGTRGGGEGGGNNRVHDGVVNQLLTMIDGVHQLNNIFIIAMTNRFDMLDPALIRKGRVDIHIPIGMPDCDGRAEILRIHTKMMKENSYLADDVKINKLAYLTENYTGGELMSLVQEATNLALHESLSGDDGGDSGSDIEDTVSIEMRHFKEAIKNVVPQMGCDTLGDDEKLLEYMVRSEVKAKVNKCLTNKSKTIKPRMLVFGESRSGKTWLLQQYYLMSVGDFEYSKFIHAPGLIGKNDREKNRVLLDMWINSKQYGKSLLVIDDVEILLGFSRIGHITHFSNETFQTLNAILKSSRAVDIMISLSDEILFEMFNKMVPDYIVLP